MTHTETVKRRKRSDGVTERTMETKKEKRERENKRTPKLDRVLSK